MRLTNAWERIVYVRLFIRGTLHLFRIVDHNKKKTWKLTRFRDIIVLLRLADQIYHRFFFCVSLLHLHRDVSTFYLIYNFGNIIVYTVHVKIHSLVSHLETFINNIQIGITQSNWFISDISFKRQVPEIWLNQIRFVFVKKLCSKCLLSHGNK